MMILRYLGVALLYPVVLVSAFVGVLLTPPVDGFLIGFRWMRDRGNGSKRPFPF